MDEPHQMPVPDRLPGEGESAFHKRVIGPALAEGFAEGIRQSDTFAQAAARRMSEVLIPPADISAAADYIYTVSQFRNGQLPISYRPWNHLPRSEQDVWKTKVIHMLQLCGLTLPGCG